MESREFTPLSESEMRMGVCISALERCAKAFGECTNQINALSETLRKYKASTKKWLPPFEIKIASAVFFLTKIFRKTLQNSP